MASRSSGTVAPLRPAPGAGVAFPGGDRRPALVLAPILAVTALVVLPIAFGVSSGAVALRGPRALQRIAVTTLAVIATVVGLVAGGWRGVLLERDGPRPTDPGREFAGEGSGVGASVELKSGLVSGNVTNPAGGSVRVWLVPAGERKGPRPPAGVCDGECRTAGWSTVVADAGRYDVIVEAGHGWSVRVAPQPHCRRQC